MVYQEILTEPSAAYRALGAVTYRQDLPRTGLHPSRPLNSPSPSAIMNSRQNGTSAAIPLTLEQKPMKTYEQINDRIASGKAVVLTADEIMDYVIKGPDRRRRKSRRRHHRHLRAMCSSGCFLNFGHSSRRSASRPGFRTSSSTLVSPPLTSTSGSTQLRHGDPANMYHPGEFRYGGGPSSRTSLPASPCSSLRASTAPTNTRSANSARGLLSTTSTSHHGQSHATENYNVAINGDKTIYTYMGTLEPNRKNAAYCSAGQLRRC